MGGAGGGRNRLCRKPLPEEVCFNADRVPAEAVMLICPLVKCCRMSTVEEGKCTMKTYSWDPQRDGVGDRGHSAVEGHRKPTRHVFIPPMSMPLHSNAAWLLWWRRGVGVGGGRVVCNAQTTSANTQTHASPPNQILQLDEEHQWEQ